MTGFVLCSGPGAVVGAVVDGVVIKGVKKCTCTLENTRFYEETNRCDCFTVINGQETGLKYNSEINRCGCFEKGENGEDGKFVSNKFITPQGTSFDRQHDNEVISQRSLKLVNPKLTSNRP